MQAEGGVVEVKYNSATLATVSGFDKNSSSDAKATSDLLVRMSCPSTPKPCSISHSGVYEMPGGCSYAQSERQAVICILYMT